MACCSSTGKWYLRWDLRSALSSSSSSCCHIRSYPWHSSRGIVADGDGVPAWPPHNTAPAPPGLASATACHTPKIQIHRFKASLIRFSPVYLSLPLSLSPSLAITYLPLATIGHRLSSITRATRHVSPPRPRQKNHPFSRPFPSRQQRFLNQGESEISLDPTYNALFVLRY